MSLSDKAVFGIFQRESEVKNMKNKLKFNIRNNGVSTLLI